MRAQKEKVMTPTAFDVAPTAALVALQLRRPRGVRTTRTTDDTQILSTLTDTQILALRTEAAAHGDDLQVVICTIAEEGALGDANGYADRFGGGGLRLTTAEIRRVSAMTQEDARLECIRVIRAAAVQA